jgi:hypothetical protein
MERPNPSPQEDDEHGGEPAAKQGQPQSGNHEDIQSVNDIPPPLGRGRPQNFPVYDFRSESISSKENSLNSPSVSAVIGSEDSDEIPLEPKSFQRSSSPAVMQRNKNAVYDKVGEEGVNNMHRFTLYETSARFYLIGQDALEKQYRVLKIDRTSAPGHLNIFEDDIVYNKREMNQLLNAIEEGNKNAGGMKLKCTSWGLLGFIRFTEAYYMLLITKRAQVAMMGGHYVYQVEATDLIPLTTGSTSRFQRDRNPEEARYLSILANFDLTKSFYYSYSYNITRTLQNNIIRERTAISENLRKAPDDFNEMFVWNHHLLEPARKALKNTYDWCIPIIHGYIEQACESILISHIVSHRD